MDPTEERGLVRPAVATETQLFLANLSKTERMQPLKASELKICCRLCTVYYCPALSLGPRAVAVLLADGTVAQSYSAQTLLQTDNQRRSHTNLNVPKSKIKTHSSKEGPL